jgi:predicted dehydrogenase
MISKALRVAIVGCGEIARVHIATLIKSEKAMITALCDPLPANRDEILAVLKAQTAWEVPPQFPSLEAALAFDDTHSMFDAVFILSPSESHEALAIKAMLAKKHVFIETPLALNVESAQRILQVARDSNVVCFVGEHSQFWHEVLLAKAVIDSGEMGRVLSCRARLAKSKQDFAASGHDLPGGSARPDALRVGGGFMFDSGLHWIRPLRIWMGNVDSIIAVGGVLPSLP